MTDIVLTEQHDLLIVDGDITLHSTEEDLTRQELKINLQNHKGNWFVDITEGIPYLENILGIRGGQDIADVLIKQAIKDTDNISNITSYTSSFEAREYRVLFSADLESGGSITLELGV
jgi:predicted phosphodiesterase